MKIFKMIFIFTFIIQNSLANPSIVLIKAKESDPIIFKAYLSSLNFQNLSDFWKSQFPIDKDKKYLQNKFIEAQKEFLEVNHFKANEIFEEIVSYAFNSFWDVDSKKIIHFSYIRLAQLQTHKLNENLIKAFQFDSQLKLDNTIFPPPIIQKYNVISKNKNLYFINAPIPTAYFRRQIYVNSKLIDIHKNEMQIPNGEFLFTVLSDEYFPLQKKFKSDEFTIKESDLKLIAGGTCESPLIDGNINSLLINSKIFYNENCVFDRNINQISSQVLNQINFKEQITFKKVIKSPWFWGFLGVSTLVAVNLINKNNQKEKVKKETRKETVVVPTHE